MDAMTNVLSKTILHAHKMQVDLTILQSYVSILVDWM